MQNIPEIFNTNINHTPDLLIHDFKMTTDVVKSKVNLSMHMFSFLQTGRKQLHFADTSIAVNPQQSLLVKNGNCLMTELLSNDKIYFCKLFFFSQKNVENFLEKHTEIITTYKRTNQKGAPFFVIENDSYINIFIDSLTSISIVNNKFNQDLLAIKFEEIMLYLLSKYGNSFVKFTNSLISDGTNSSFRKIVEANANSNLKLEEIAFLCNMSLSTFKRYFVNEYQTSPGKWLQQKRLKKAREILLEGKQKPSEIYSDLGYNNLSNFSIAFKNEFGFSPKKITPASKMS